MCHEKECYLIETGYWINKDKAMFARNKFLPYKLIGALINERKNTGIFYTTYRYNIEDQENAYLFGDMYFDFDSKTNFESVREDALQTLSYLKVVYKIQPEETKIYFSGSKGVHITVPTVIMGVQPHKQLNKIFRKLAENVKKYTPRKTLDLVIYDNKRLFRVPASIHESTGLYKIPITVDELRNLSHKKIKELAKSPRYFTYPEAKSNTFALTRYKELVKQYEEDAVKVVKVQYKKKLNCTPPCIKHLLDQGALNGNRNNSIAVLASFYKNSGMEMNEAVTKIQEWNEELNVPPTQPSELAKTVRSIFSGSTSYGCNTLKIVSQCDEANCPLKKKGGTKNGRRSA